MINTSATAYRGQATLPPPKQETQISVKFWGVRGSVPTPTPAYQRYGGNTICVEFSMGDQRIICDGGTGLVGLGHALLQEQAPTQAHILFTHTQWDRIQGFPFFQPAFSPHNHFSMYGGTAPNGASIKHCLTDQMLKPHFSMPLQHMRAELAFHTLSAQEQFHIGDVSVETFKTNPVTEALGYRLTWKNHSLVYATDTPTEGVTRDFLNFVDCADMLIYDGTYADLTYLSKGVGDPSPDNPSPSVEPWELGLEIAQKAQIKEIVFLHHSPMQDDVTLDQLQRDIEGRATSATHATIAYEGMEINL
jgi:phosphoribosyl 1,2-cyclic phosphodiesterase